MRPAPILAVLVSLASFACATKKADVKPLVDADLRSRPTSSPVRPTPALVEEALARPNPLEVVIEPAAPPPALAFPTVGFEFDSDLLTREGREALDTFAADWRVRREAGRLVIQGHADERGPEEYNLVLGQRRAAAVRTYLERLGIADEAMRAVSFGENRPVDGSGSEAALSRNRRAEVAID